MGRIELDRTSIRGGRLVEPEPALLHDSQIAVPVRPLRLEYIDVIKGGNEEEIMDIQFVSSFPVKGMDLIVLKDVIRSGVIETWLSSQLPLPAHRKVQSIRRIELFLDRVLLHMIAAHGERAN